jgi:hypothetical protein
MGGLNTMSGRRIEMEIRGNPVLQSKKEILRTMQMLK